MNKEELYNGITDIREDLIERTNKHVFKNRNSRRKRWISAAASVMVLVILSGALLWFYSDFATISAYSISEADYPEMAQYPDNSLSEDEYTQAYEAWQEDRQEQYDQPKGYADGLYDFFAKSIPQFLSGSNGENMVYSPLNVYMALGILAELTDGNSRQQILDLLGSDSIEVLRTQASSIWNANYCDDGTVTSVLASSLWLDQGIHYVPSTLETLAETYYASSFQGEMGSDGFNKALQDWLNQQTGGILNKQISETTLKEDTILALATTIYYQAEWEDAFSEQETKQDIFHSENQDLTCDFMYLSDTKMYCWGERFSAVGQSLLNSGSMWFLLPEEGVSPEELLDDPETLDFILSPEISRFSLSNKSWDNKELKIVHLSVPKFDITSNLDLISGLKELGITDVFDDAVSDFTPLSQNDLPIYVSEADHAARVSIDENGCTAAAFTFMRMTLSGSSYASDEIDFVLNRPFLFVVTGNDNLPLFVGIVNEP